MRPFFSIIVVSLNAEEYMDKTIKSIQMQLFEDYEVVVKDGGSKDATLSFVPKDDGRFQIYESPDKGLYDAMNQAIERTTGKYVIFMNCGDVFADENILGRVKDAIGEAEFVFFYGDYSRDGIVHKQPDKLTSYYMYRTPLCHQTIFFNGEMLRSGDNYNTVYSILADYDLELRLRKLGNTGYMSLVICNYQGGGVSESKAGIRKKEMERRAIIRNTFSLNQRVLYGIKYHATLPKMRTVMMYSDKTPMCIKRVYQSIVNSLNK